LLAFNAWRPRQLIALAPFGERVGVRGLGPRHLIKATLDQEYA
jgi:hypothetical protein